MRKFRPEFSRWGCWPGSVHTWRFITLCGLSAVWKLLQYFCFEVNLYSNFQLAKYIRIWFCFLTQNLICKGKKKSNTERRLTPSIVYFCQYGIQKDVIRTRNYRQFLRQGTCKHWKSHCQSDTDCASPPTEAVELNEEQKKKKKRERERKISICMPKIGCWFYRELWTHPMSFCRQLAGVRLLNLSLSFRNFERLPWHIYFEYNLLEVCWF